MERFQCRRCGRCCRWPGYVRLTHDEVDAIAGFLEMTPEAFAEKYTRLTADRSGLSLVERADGVCVFLTEARPAACRIEAVKPRQCRDFPEKWNFPGWEKECPGGDRT